ncbi:MAG TPA: hypothetical protein PLL72_00105 [Burkholderiaceae bacterium]|nr:hypothetical protein [Burkholderiaceae bacterium]
MRSFHIVVLASLLALLGGCAPPIKHMQVSAMAKSAVIQPAQGKALVVFVRPSDQYQGMQSSVFRVGGDGAASLIGIMASSTKLAYQAEPGQHLFMAIGEDAGFMTANLQAGRTYYVLIDSQSGHWKARFALEPVKPALVDSGDFRNSLANCVWVEKTADSEQWAHDNRNSIEGKRAKHYPKWQAEPTGKKAALQPEDGR